MSFILDALRKAERDRNLGQAPRIEDVALAQQRTEPAAASGRRRGLRLIGLAALLIVIGLLAMLLLRKPVAPPAAVTVVAPGVVNATVRGPARVEPPPAATPAVIAEPEDTGPPALAEDEDLSSLDDLTQTPADKAAAVAEPAEPEVRRPRDFIARPATADTGDEAYAEAPPPRPVPPQAAPPTRLSSLTGDAASATPLSAMSPAYRADFPELTVEVHVWDSDPARRFVLVGGKRYAEGQTLEQGPRLAEIAQDGLVLEYRGSRVLYSLQ